MKRVFLDISPLIKFGENVVVCEKDGTLKYPEENNEERKVYEVKQGDVIIYVKIHPDKDYQWYGLYQVKEIEEKVDGQTIVVEDVDDVKGVWIEELTTFDLYDGMEQWGDPKLAAKYADAIEAAEMGVKYKKEEEYNGTHKIRRWKMKIEEKLEIFRVKLLKYEKLLLEDEENELLRDFVSKLEILYKDITSYVDSDKERADNVLSEILNIL